MKYKIIAPERLNAQLALPLSKSISNRVLVIKALCNGDFAIGNLSNCEDTKIMSAAINARKSAGTQIIDVGNCGTAMRFLTAYLSVQKGEYILTGNDRMKCRPIGALVDALRSLGAGIEYIEKDGVPPLKISGKEIAGGSVEISGTISSQFISSLLLIAPTLKRGLKLTIIDETASKPYIDLTIWTMKTFGIKIDHSDPKTIIVPPQEYEPHDFTVESDWSAAVFWYEMVALSNDPEAEIIIENISEHSLQGDRKAKEFFETLNVHSEIIGHRLTIRKKTPAASCTTLNYDFSDCPDIAPTIIATCRMLGVKASFTGVENLRFKESDRLNVLNEELNKINGFTDILEFESHEDHRIAMTLASLSFKSSSVVINNPECVKKSYPSFWNDLRKAGFSIAEL